MKPLARIIITIQQQFGSLADEETLDTITEMLQAAYSAGLNDGLADSYGHAPLGFDHFLTEDIDESDT